MYLYLELAVHFGDARWQELPAGGGTRKAWRVNPHSTPLTPHSSLGLQRYWEGGMKKSMGGKMRSHIVPRPSCLGECMHPPVPRGLEKWTPGN